MKKKSRECCYALLLFVACLAGVGTRCMGANPVGEATARIVAERFFNTIAPKDYFYDSTAFLHEIGREAGLTESYLFVCRYGFVLVAGNDAALPIMAYGNQPFEDGAMPGVDPMPENVMEWLLDYEGELRAMRRENVAPSDITYQAWQSLLKSSAQSKSAKGTSDYLVKYRWNQSYPYNMLCPYDGYYGATSVTGCVATAMAQIMAYWQYPIRGTGSHSYESEFGNLSANFGQTRYDWSNMPYSMSGANETQRRAVATLMYHCGVALEMKYHASVAGGSSAYVCQPPAQSQYSTPVKALPAFFDYHRSLKCVSRSDYGSDAWLGILCNEIDEGRPILYSGSDGTTGHAFIVDGYDENTYFHINWGWGGGYDGFFQMGAFNPYGHGAGSNATNTFNQSNSAVVGIIPNGTLKCSPMSISFGEMGGYSSFSVSSDVTCEDRWVVDNNNDWFNIFPRSGAGEGAMTMISVKVDSNNTGAVRKGYFFIRQGTRSVTVEVMQNDCSQIDSFPYLEDFEMGVTCWQQVTMSNDNDASCNILNNSKSSYRGDNCFSFGSTYTSSNYNQYLISPPIQFVELDTNGNPVQLGESIRRKCRFEFYYNRLYSYTELFRILGSYTDSRIESFTDTLGEYQTSTSGWRFAAVDVPDSVRYVAINYYSNNQREMAVDNLRFTVKYKDLLIGDVKSLQVLPQIDVDGRRLSISSPQRGKVAVYDAVGRCIGSASCVNEANIAMPSAGLYVVRFVPIDNGLLPSSQKIVCY